VLDVASGTGEPAISIATFLKGTGEVIATDLSEQPLKIAEQRAAQRGLTNIQFRVADVHQLPLEDASFDRVTCRLGLMFFADLAVSLREIRRVLKRGGRFSAAAWGPIAQHYFDTTVGTVREMCPELNLPESAKRMFRFCTPGVLAEPLRAAGFRHTEEGFREVDWTWEGSSEDCWDYFQAVTIPFAPLLTAIPPDRKKEVDRAVLKRVESISCNGRISFKGLFVVANAIA
jgi:SAM-dependent methyltransferase